MMKFTKEEISLCKQVAEKHRKSLIKGDWYWNEEWKEKEMIIAGMTIKNQKLLGCFKLWTISDCFEFLKERGWYIFKLEQWIGSDTWQLIITNPENLVGSRAKEGRPSKTPLEACLRAVLAVLEEGK